jgi:hypothetical protein
MLADAFEGIFIINLQALNIPFHSLYWGSICRQRFNGSRAFLESGSLSKNRQGNSREEMVGSKNEIATGNIDPHKE